MKESWQCDASAQRDLGACFHEGVGVRRDDRAAARWYRMAARQGDVMAQFNLGLCYRDGDGVAVDYRKSRYWLRRVASVGHRRAKSVLKQLSAGGRNNGGLTTG